MAFGWSKSRYSPIAVDFGSDSLKLLQVIPSDPPQLAAAAAATVPEHVRSEPTARAEFLTQTLRKLLSDGGFKGKRAVCSIPAYQTLIQNLQVNRNDQEDMTSQVEVQLRQRLNIEPSRMVVRHFPVGQVVRDGATKQEVLCIAASREAIMRHIETAHRAKLDVVGMHDEPTSILRAFAHLYRSESESARTTCFIDMGAATTKAVIAHGGEMVFAKSIHAAGDHQTRELAKSRGLRFDEARELRIASASGNAAAPTPEPAAAAGAAPAAKAEAASGIAMLDAQVAAQPATESVEPIVAADTLDCLIDELQLCVRYHNSIFPNRPIEKLVFLGGESRHVTVCQKIARALRIGAQLGDPLARLVRVTGGKTPGVDLSQPQPGWAVPLGLCLFGDEQ